MSTFFGTDLDQVVAERARSLLEQQASVARRRGWSEYPVGDLERQGEHVVDKGSGRCSTRSTTSSTRST
jgi:hypothetical protein